MLVVKFVLNRVRIPKSICSKVYYIKYSLIVCFFIIIFLQHLPKVKWGQI